MSTSQSRKMFVNLPVSDLTKSVEFFKQLGFEFNAQFTDDNATCMIISDDAFVMLLVDHFFKSFITKDLADTATHAEAICALSAESRDEVDQLVEKALAAGGQPAGDATDHGFMYERGFQDLDGHIWSVFWMDPDAIGE